MTGHSPSFAPFQLPASWDGRDVEWRAWTSTWTTAELHVRRDPCERCGSLAVPLMNQGVVHPPATPGAVNLRRSLLQLTAFRCPDCHLDTVWDRDTDDWWVLDESDYGPQGSHDPRLPMEVTAVISCRDLWWRDDAWAPTLLRGSLRPDGRLIVTDRSLALYVTELEGCTGMPAPAEMAHGQVVLLTHILVMPWLDEAPTAEFDARYLDVLEFAGYVVRPLGARTTRRKLVGYRHAHAVVSRAGRVVGALMPLSTVGGPAAPGTTRKAAA